MRVRDEIDLIKRTKAAHSWRSIEERRATTAAVHTGGNTVSVVLKRPDQTVIAVYRYRVGSLPGGCPQSYQQLYGRGGRFSPDCTRVPGIYRARVNTSGPSTR